MKPRLHSLASVSISSSLRLSKSAHFIRAQHSMHIRFLIYIYPTYIFPYVSLTFGNFKFEHSVHVHPLDFLCVYKCYTLP